MNILLKNHNSERKMKYAGPEKGGLAFCLLSVFLLLCLLVSPAAAAVEWKITPSNPAVGDTLKIKGTASPDESLKAEISFEKAVPVCRGRYQYLLQNIKVPDGKDNLFAVRADGVKNLHVGVYKFLWINLTSEASGGVATISQGHVPPLTYEKILIDGDADKKKCSVNLRVTASQTLKADSKGKFEYSYDTSSMPAGKFNIKIGNVEKTLELRSKEQKKPVSEFSASPASGKAPLKVSFTDKSAGKPTSWKWSFGDGTYSTQQNPVHTYKKAGKYTVSLSVKNAGGTDTETKCSYITVSTPSKPPVAKFSASPVSGKTPLKVSFTDKSTGNPTSWAWSFGDGTYSTSQNPVHKYNKAGKYTVSLKVKTAGGTDTETKCKYITVSTKK